MNDAYNVSILDQVKTQIGYPADVRVFDNAIIPVVNSALAFLHQVGIGPSIPFMITGPTETWADFWAQSETDTTTAMAMEYVHLKVWSVFDPPSKVGMQDTLREMITELENRMTDISDAANSVYRGGDNCGN